jgi:predicted permease
MSSQLRLAFRTLARNPGFTLVAVLTLALGIGMNISAFSFANSFLLRALPYPDSGSLMRIFRTNAELRTGNHAPGFALQIASGVRSLEDVTLFGYDQTSMGTPGRPAESINGLQVSPSFLHALRMQPSLGRDFSAGDDQSGAPKLIILTHRGWQRRFGLSPSVLGKTMRLDGENYQVVGVLPASFDAPLVWGTAEYIRPLTRWTGIDTDFSNNWLNLFGRLKPGFSEQQVGSELATLGATLASDHPKELANCSLRTLSLHNSNMEGINSTLVWLMTGLGLLVLVVACANLASLQLARALGRLREMAIRSALGAGRRHVMMPILLESMLLAIAGGMLGIIFAGWMDSWVGSRMFMGDEVGFDVGMDAKVFAYAVVITLFTGVAFGIVPAWLISRSTSTALLKDGARGSTSGPTHNRFRSILIIGEIAISLVLVCTAASFAVAGSRISKRDLGWRQEGLYHGTVNLPWNRYGSTESKVEANRALLQRLRNIPGATKVALGTGSPLFGFYGNEPLVIEGQEAPKPGMEPLSENTSVSGEYFTTMEIPLREGRVLTDDLKQDGPKLAVVNESFARRFWPGQSALGHRFRPRNTNEWIEIVGVVGDIRMALNIGAQTTKLQYFTALSQYPGNYLTILARGKVAPSALSEPIRREMAAIDPDVPVSQSGAMVELIERFMSNMSLLVFNLGSCALMGLFIATIGIYGVLTHLASQRTRDIGVRMALGAGAEDILRMVLMQGVRLLSLGLVFGMAGSWALSRLLQQSMPELGLPGSWIQFATMGGIGLITLVACWLPARRASLTDPLVALRAD